MSEYLLLIYGDESEWINPTPELGDKIMEGHARVWRMSTLTVSVAATPCNQPARPRRSRESSSGQFVVTDGAFTETKEALAGDYLVEAANLDEALAMAKEIPAASGGVEVRPIRVFD